MQALLQLLFSRLQFLSHGLLAYSRLGEDGGKDGSWSHSPFGMVVLSSHEVLFLHFITQAFLSCLHVFLHFFLVLLYGGGDDGDSGMGEGVPGGEGGGGEGEGSSTPAARTIGIHCGGLAPPRMRLRVFELRGKTARGLRVHSGGWSTAQSSRSGSSPEPSERAG